MSQAALTMVATEMGLSEKGNPLKTADKILDEFESLQAQVTELETKLAQVETKPCAYFAAQVADCLGFEDVPPLMGSYLSRACEIVRKVGELETECTAISELARDYVDGDGMTLVRYLAGEETALAWMEREAPHLLPDQDGETGS